MACLRSAGARCRRWCSRWCRRAAAAAPSPDKQPGRQPHAAAAASAQPSIECGSRVVASGAESRTQISGPDLICFLLSFLRLPLGCFEGVLLLYPALLLFRLLRFRSSAPAPPELAAWPPTSPRPLGLFPAAAASLAPDRAAPPSGALTPGWRPACAASRPRIHGVTLQAQPLQTPELSKAGRQGDQPAVEEVQALEVDRAAKPAGSCRSLFFLRPSFTRWVRPWKSDGRVVRLLQGRSSMVDGGCSQLLDRDLIQVAEAQGQLVAVQLVTEVPALATGLGHGDAS